MKNKITTIMQPSIHNMEEKISVRTRKIFYDRRTDTFYRYNTRNGSLKALPLSNMTDPFKGGISKNYKRFSVYGVNYYVKLKTKEILQHKQVQKTKTKSIGITLPVKIAERVAEYPNKSLFVSTVLKEYFKEHDAELKARAKAELENKVRIEEAFNIETTITYPVKKEVKVEEKSKPNTYTIEILGGK